MIGGETGTTLLEFDGSKALAPYTTAVSLHAHTNCSKEVMTVVPTYFARIPVIAPVGRREMYAYPRRCGDAVDFANCGVAPEAILASDGSQIMTTLGQSPIASITGHNSVGAGLALRQKERSRCVPRSLEWTVWLYHGSSSGRTQSAAGLRGSGLSRAVSVHPAPGCRVWIRLVRDVAPRSRDAGDSQPSAVGRRWNRVRGSRVAPAHISHRRWIPSGVLEAVTDLSGPNASCHEIVG